MMNSILRCFRERDMRKIRIANAEGRDATVAYETLREMTFPNLDCPVSRLPLSTSAVAQGAP